MKRITQVVWIEDGTDRELLRANDDGTYNVIVATCDPGALGELAKACIDALRLFKEGADVREYAREADIPTSTL